MKSVIIVWT